MLLGYQHLLKTKKIILASKSPARKLLLQNIGLEFEVFPSDYPEDLDKAKYPNPIDYVKDTCYGKAINVRDKLKEINKDYDIIICADTICVLDNKIIEKPTSNKDAFDMISSFMNKWHEVHTSLWLIVRKDGTKEDLVENIIATSRVKFGSIPVESLEEYSKLDSIKIAAGGYQIQGLASSMIETMEGSHTNIIGLPIFEFCTLLIKMMKEAGYKI